MTKEEDKNQNKKKVINISEIKAEGSLGLLALGAVGIKAWREKRKEIESAKKDIPKNE